MGKNMDIFFHFCVVCQRCSPLDGLQIADNTHNSTQKRKVAHAPASLQQPCRLIWPMASVFPCLCSFVCLFVCFLVPDPGHCPIFRFAAACSWDKRQRIKAGGIRSPCTAHPSGLSSSCYCERVVEAMHILFVSFSRRYRCRLSKWRMVMLMMAKRLITLTLHIETGEISS